MCWPGMVLGMFGLWAGTISISTCSEVVAIFPNPSLILVVTITTNTPMQNINAPGINIASLSSAVDMDPMMRSGKPIMSKVMPTTNDAVIAGRLFDSTSA